MNSKTISLLGALAVLAAAERGGEETPAAPQAAPKPAAAPGAPAAPGPKSPAARKLEEGQGLEKARRHDEALAKLREAMVLEPDRALAAEVLLETGKVHFQKGIDAQEGKIPGADPEPSFGEAIKVFEDLLKRFPREEKTSSGAYLLGSSYLLSGDLEKALAAYQRVFDEYRSAKDSPMALIRMGVCQAGLDQPSKAREAFEKFLMEFPANPDVPRIRKFIDETSIAGRPAFPIGATRWLHGLVGPDGIKAFEGQVVVLVFFATWCPNCQKELPHLRTLMKRWGKSDVIFLGVANPEDPQSTIPVEAYVQKNDLPFFDVALDRTASAWRPYRITAFPAAVIVDRKAVVRWRSHLAFFPNPLVEKLLKERG